MVIMEVNSCYIQIFGVERLAMLHFEAVIYCYIFLLKYFGRNDIE